jgi:hypothetical protein
MKYLNFNVFLLLFFTLLSTACQKLEKELVKPDDREYTLSIDDSKVVELLNQVENEGAINGRISGIQFREDSVLVVENDITTLFSIPVIASTAGASENLVIVTDETGIVKSAIYSLQPDADWIHSHYNGVNTDFSTFEGKLGLYDIHSGELMTYSNITRQSSARSEEMECAFTVTHYYH